MTAPPYVARELDAETVDRQWDGIQERLHPASKTGWWLPAGMVAATAAAVAVAVLLWMRWSGAALPAMMQTEGHARAIEVRDGPTLTLSGYTTAKACDDDRRRCIEVTKGNVRVAMRPKTRRFEVRAAAVVMQGEHATFDVENAPEGPVTVVVERGVVTVSTGGERIALVAGQRWSSATVVAMHEQLHEPPLAPTPIVPSEVADPAPVEETVLPADAPEPPRTPRPKAQGRKDRHQELWATARTARRSQDHDGAQRALAEIVRRYPGDGLAALELGRLRMDALGDSRGAIKPLQQALRAKLGASFRDDATARLVRALAAVGRTARCQKVRARYLADFPSGVHRKTVARACPDGQTQPD